VTHAREVNPVEKHRELRGIQLGAQRPDLHFGQPKATLLQPLVRQDETAVVPSNNLQPSAAA